jgi:hypothetical protein
MPHMNKIKRAFPERPFAFCIVDLKAYIGRNPAKVRALFSSQKELVYMPTWLNWAEISSDDFSGWIAPNEVYQLSDLFFNKEISTHSATSIAQIPVPVPISRILCGFRPIGARFNLSSMSML